MNTRLRIGLAALFATLSTSLGTVEAASVQVGGASALGNNTFGTAYNLEGEFEVAPNVGVSLGAGLTPFTSGSPLTLTAGAKYYLGSLDAGAVPYLAARFDRLADFDGRTFWTAGASLGYRALIGGDVFLSSELGLAVPLGPVAAGDGVRGTAVSIRGGFGFRF